MAGSLRDIRRKMKAIKSTRQVTKALELVSASKMRRAVQNAQLLRRYALTAWAVLQRIASASGEQHPYLEERPVGKVLLVLFSSDRGQCGSLNAQLFRTAMQYVEALKKLPGFQSLECAAVGRKGQQFLAARGEKLIAAFPALSNNPRFREVLPLTRLATEAYLKGEYDHVVIVYTHFISALQQIPIVKVLLPFSETALKAMIDELRTERAAAVLAPALISDASSGVYTFEPSPEEVLKAVLPQLTETQMYQAVLESAASEHSARMVAMRNATDNATEILDDLTLTYNQTRQANITAELAELSGAKAALD